MFEACAFRNNSYYHLIQKIALAYYVLFIYERHKSLLYILTPIDLTDNNKFVKEHEKNMIKSLNYVIASFFTLTLL